MKETPFIVLGAGGHARVVIDALKTCGADIIGCLDPKAGLRGERVDGIAVLGGDEALKDRPAAAVSLANGVGGARDTASRRALFLRLREQGYRFPPIISSASYRSPSVTLGEGCQLLTRAVVHPGSAIGENTVINTGAIVEHDGVVGAHAFVGPGAILCGDVRLADNVYVGAGAMILPGVRVGDGAHIGAGAVVSKDVPPGAKARGSRLIKGAA